MQVTVLYPVPLPIKLNYVYINTLQYTHSQQKKTLKAFYFFEY